MSLKLTRGWVWVLPPLAAVAVAVWGISWGQSGCGFSGCIPGGNTNSVQYNTGGSFGGVGPGTVTTVLHGNASNAPAYSGVDLTADVINVLPMGGGGTGTGAVSANQLLVSNGSAWVSTSLPDCTSASGNNLNYAQSTSTFGCSSPGLSGTTASIGGGLLAVGGCTSGTVSVPNATTSMVAAASPNTYPGDGTWWDAQVTSAGTVTVKLCATVAVTPAAGTYNVRVIR